MASHWRNMVDAAVQARLVLGNGSPTIALVSPLGSDTYITTRTLTKQPLLDYYWSSYSTNATHAIAQLTFTPQVTVAGAAALHVTAAQDLNGGTALPGSPVAVSVVAGALVSAQWSAPAVDPAGDGLSVDMVALVRCCLL